MSFLTRYEAGEREQVWREIYPRNWKEAHSEPFFSDALAVARATMRRVRQNIEVLIPRLQSIGYSFGYGWIEAPSFKRYDAVEEWAQGEPPVLSPPLTDIEVRFQRLEEAGLHLPLSIRAWYEVVGGVNFVGMPPSHWAGRNTYCHDPLRVDPLGDDILSESVSDRRLIVAPDEFHKFFTSGGGPYYLKLSSSPSTDGYLEGGWLKVPFVEYLRVALSWGGFPGIGRWHRRPEKDIAFLTEGLSEF